MRALLIVLAVTAALFASARSARAETPEESAEAMFRLAEADDARGDYARAMERYRAVVATLPSSRWAPRAATRASVLEAHAEGDFKPFSRLEHVRSDPARADDPHEIDALARDADAFPPGLSRVEAWMVCADAYLGRLARPNDGIAELRKVLEDAKADALTRRTAAKLYVDALTTEGDLDLAAREADRLSTSMEPKDVKHAHVLVRRRALRKAAVADVAGVMLLASVAIGASIARGGREAIVRALRASVISSIVFAAWIACAGGVLASAYERGNAAPFVAFGAVTAPLVILARAWGAAGSASSPARFARALACASSLVAAAFLVLEAVDASYLEGFGL